ncbi:MAG: NAD(P)H-hydrate dehydratase [Bacteroidales bacterium]|nr:NAD(P)H-hydrate dehydratase [Bacteroidales bacterium]
MRKIGENIFEVDHIDLPDIMNHRKPETTKKDYGHALLLAGSMGKMGAAVLAAKACMRVGAGLLTVHVPACGVEVMQTAVPEAMVSVDAHDFMLSSLPDNLSRYNAIAIGPGIGVHRRTVRMLRHLLKALAEMQRCSSAPLPVLILDADALNIVASLSEVMLPMLPAATIVTPHEGEYTRLFGSADPHRMAVDHRLTIVKKAHHTHTYSCKGQEFINLTGNAGMATAGSGDALTGIILGLAAQHCSPIIASMMGVYLHGRAADLAALNQSQASLLASDIIENLKSATM